MLATSRIRGLKQALSNHTLYTHIQDPDTLRLFMQHHVFCVWDFMSLLKSLQQQLTGSSLPWLPPENPALARLINEIVLDEETDLVDGEAMSHFELYLQAMREVGCDMQPIHAFLNAIRSGMPLQTAFYEAKAPAPVTTFVSATFKLLQLPLPLQAAAFFHAREDIIPEMFVSMVRGLRHQGLKCDSFLYYLERHIHLDSDEHGPRAKKLLEDLLIKDMNSFSEVETVVEQALQSRLDLWDTLACEFAQSPLTVA